MNVIVPVVEFVCIYIKPTLVESAKLNCPPVVNVVILLPDTILISFSKTVLLFI